MNTRTERYTDTRSTPQHDPNADSWKTSRDELIRGVTQELKRRHGGNDVLNRLEAEILVDHYLSRNPGREDSPDAGVTAVIRASNSTASGSAR